MTAGQGALSLPAPAAMQLTSDGERRDAAHAAWHTGLRGDDMGWLGAGGHGPLRRCWACTQSDSGTASAAARTSQVTVSKLYRSSKSARTPMAGARHALPGCCAVRVFRARAHSSRSLRVKDALPRRLHACTPGTVPARGAYATTSFKQKRSAVLRPAGSPCLFVYTESSTMLSECEAWYKDGNMSNPGP